MLGSGNQQEKRSLEGKILGACQEEATQLVFFFFSFFFYPVLDIRYLSTPGPLPTLLKPLSRRIQAPDGVNVTLHVSSHHVESLASRQGKDWHQESGMSPRCPLNCRQSHQSRKVARQPEIAQISTTMLPTWTNPLDYNQSASIPQSDFCQSTCGWTRRPEWKMVE